MDINGLLESVVDDILFILWWIVPAKLFKWNLNWLRTIPWKVLPIVYIGFLILGGIIRAMK